MRIKAQMKEAARWMEELMEKEKEDQRTILTEEILSVNSVIKPI